MDLTAPIADRIAGIMAIRAIGAAALIAVVPIVADPITAAPAMAALIMEAPTMEDPTMEEWAMAARIIEAVCQMSMTAMATSCLFAAGAYFS